MTSQPHTPQAAHNRLGRVFQVVFTLAVGMGVYYSLVGIDELVSTAGDGGASDAIVAKVAQPLQQEGKLGPGVGNGLVQNALEVLQRKRSVAARVAHRGWIDGRPFEAIGHYLQVRGGSERQFLLKLHGHLAETPMRLLRVSDSRLLWTDLAWGDQDASDRSITRVDLRRVRRSLAEGGLTDSLSVDPNAWSRYGGLPTLLAGLDQAFHFQSPQRMQQGRRTVLATLGYWRGETTPETPDHVIVAFDQRSLFPTLIEYRGQGDTTSGVDPFLPHRQPLLRIRLEEESLTERPDTRLFAFNPSEAPWTDVTERELRLVAARREQLRMANSGGSTAH